MKQPESSDFDTDDVTLDDLDDPSVCGEYTEQLSEYSRHDDVQGSSKLSKLITFVGHVTGGLYHADAPALNENPTKYSRVYANQSFCIYDWAEWSECSATCSTDDKPAYRYRRVKPSSVIDMRSITPDTFVLYVPFKVLTSIGNSDCYDIMQYSPCNVYKCPRPITDFDDWGPCQYIHVREKQCHQLRTFDPLMLVNLTETVQMSRPCFCSETSLPW